MVENFRQLAMDELNRRTVGQDANQKRTVDWWPIPASLAMTAAAYFQYRLFYHDDAYISLRYLQNFFEGRGLVWNPGERVEGYTNFLFMALTGLLSRLGLDLVDASRALGVASLLALLAFVFAFTRRHYGDSETPWMLPFILTATAIPLVVWSLSGLETLFFCFLVTASVWLFLSRTAGGLGAGAALGLLFSLAVMTRPPGVVFLAATGLFGLWSWRRTKWPALRVLIVMGAAFLLLYLPYFVWRMSYYGDFLPNTFYVKGDFSLGKLWMGLQYFQAFVFSPPYVLGLAATASVFALRRKKMDASTAYLIFASGLFLAYLLYVGGDHMPAFRFFVPLIPTLALIFYKALAGLVEWNRRQIHLVYALTLSLAAVPLLFPQPQIAKAKLTDRAAFIGKIVGEYINENWGSGLLIAVSTAGSTPYYAPGNTYIDMLGLNDRHIAHRPLQDKEFLWKGIPGHEKGDGLYVLSRKPDYIIVGPASGMRIDFPWFLSDVEMKEAPEFHESYEIQYVFIDITDVPRYDQYFELVKGRLPFIYYQRRSAGPIRQAGMSAPSASANGKPN